MTGHHDKTPPGDDTDLDPATAMPAKPGAGGRGFWGGLKLRRENIGPDLAAGATFAVVNVPQGMANAVLATVNPVAGLYALMVAMPIGALFTSSVFMNVSTTGAMSVAAGNALVDIAEPDKLQALATLVLMIGAAQLTFGLLGFGRLVRFISHAVMTGFITGVAVLIVLGSIPDLTGYQSAQSTSLLRFADTLLNWRRVDAWTFVFGVATIAAIFAFQKTRLNKFALILALAVVTPLVALWSLGLQMGHTTLVGDIAQIPRALPVPVLPDLQMIGHLLLPAIAIAVIGLIQGAGVGQSYPNPGGTFPDTSRDFVGQGAANLAGGLFGGIPSGGSMSGTAVTVQAGAQSRWANIFSAVFVVLIVLLLVDAVKMVPMAALGGLLFVVGLQNIQPAELRMIWHTGRATRAAMLVTFAATLMLPLQYAIAVGVALSFLLHVLRSSDRIEVREFALVEGGFPTERPAPKSLEPNTVVVLRIRGSLYFASVQAFESQMPDVSRASGTSLILVLRDIDDLGSTAIRFIKRYAAALQRQGGRLLLCGVSSELRAQLDRTGLSAQLGEDAIFAEQPGIGASLNDALAEARRGLPAT